MNRHLAEIVALIDEAETRPLTADEAVRIRNVLHGYEQARRQLGAILAKPRRQNREAA